MSHEIDMTNERANIAFAGETPWHGLGVPMEAGMTLDQWRAAAGLSHEVHRSVVEYKVPGEDSLRIYGDRNVLYRDDTMAPLSVVGKDYKIVQPRQVLDFFVALIERNKFEMECAGSLDGGRRIWALAKVNDGDCVVGVDRVRPYILLATSYDTSMSTVAIPTSVRVVCANTLHMSMSDGDAEKKAIHVPHTEAFDPTKVRLDLSIALNAYEAFMINARKLATARVDARFCAEFLRSLLPLAVSKQAQLDGTVKAVVKPIEDTKAYQSIMALFRGEAIGSGMVGTDGTAWQLMNAISQWTDHSRGHKQDGRMNSAWFGQSVNLKTAAFAELAKVCA